MIKRVPVYVEDG